VGTGPGRAGLAWGLGPDLTVVPAESGARVR